MMNSIPILTPEMNQSLHQLAMRREPNLLLFASDDDQMWIIKIGFQECCAICGESFQDWGDEFWHGKEHFEKAGLIEFL